MRNNEGYKFGTGGLGPSVSTSSLFKNRVSLFPVKPTNKLPLNQLKVSHVLRDVFTEYLDSDTLSLLSAWNVKAESSESDIKVNEEELKTSTEDEEYRLINYFGDQTPSEIRQRLALHIKNLKSARETTQHEIYLEEQKCEHLPRGFSKDQVELPTNVTCVKEEVSSGVTEDLLLMVEPREILFDDYSVGSTFKKKCWVRNCSSGFMKGRITQPFSPELSLNNFGNLSLSAGLSIQLVISFCPTNLKPSISSFSIIIERGPDQYREVKVPIIASRPPPMLKGFELFTSLHSLEIIKYLNSGEALISSTKPMIVKLVNVGSQSTFILTDDKTISNFDEAEIEEKFEVNSIPFTLRPCKFTLDRDESVEVEIEFKPNLKQKFTQEITILCTDDICNDQFKLIGEGVTIKRKNIVFNNLDKNFSIDIEDDMLAEHYIDLKKVFPSQTQQKCFTLNNKSVIPLKYRWEYRLAVVDSDYFDIPQDCLQIFPQSGILERQSEEDFTITCQMKSAVPYFYKSVFSLIIDELTVDSVEEDDDIYIVEPDNSSSSLQKTISLNCGEIEIWVEVVLPEIIVTPCILETTLFYSNMSKNIEVKVKNVSHEKITLAWKKNESNLHPNLSIKIRPYESVLISSRKTASFEVETSFNRTTLSGINSFEETLTCELNDGECYCDIIIKIDFFDDEKVERSRIEAGSLNQEEFNKDLIHLEPANMEDLLKIYEEKLKDIIVEFNSSGDYIQNTDEYTASMLDFISKNCLTSEGLVFYVFEWEDDAGWIIGDIRGYNVVLTPPKLEMFMFHQFHDSASIVIHNRSLVPTKFKWGESYGCDSEMLKIWFKNTGDYLLPNCKVTVDIYVFPLQYGLVRDFMIPCYIKHMSEPLILELKGTIEPLRILLQWDIEQGFYQTSWDPVTNDSNLSNYRESVYDDNVKGLSCDLKKTFEADSAVKIAGDVREKVINEFYGNRCRADTNLPDISTRTLIGINEPPRSATETPHDSFMMFLDACGPLGCQIANAVSKVLYDKALRFNVLIGESQSQIISIKNLTPIKTSFSVKPEIFCWEEEAPEYPDYLCEDTCFEYDNACPPCLSNRTIKRIVGLYLHTDPSISELDSYQEIEVEVTANPDVWGEYVDVLVIRVIGLPSYSVPVFINAVGSPITFTFDPRSHPHLRFGTLKPGEESSQEVTLKNNSYVPLKIAWCTYCKPQQTKENDSNIENLPFSLAVDIHSPINESFCKLDLFDYFGFQKDSPYQVCPCITYLVPFGVTKMKMSVKVPQASEEGLLEGTCLGLIHEDSFQRNKWRSLCHRSTGLSKQFELKMTTYVEIPSVKLISGGQIKQHLCFMVDAKHIVEKKEIIISKQYTLKNMSRTDTLVNLEVEPPFSITQLLHRDGKKIKFKDTNNFHLHPQQMITVKLSLKVTQDSLEEDEDLFQDEIIEMIISRKQSQLYIHQPNVQKTEEVRLHYEIHYPFFKFSCKRLVFGPVFVNEIKVIILRITAISGQEKYSIEHRDLYKKNSPFSFTPTSGILEQGHYIEIPVSFHPRESTGYLEEIKINTSIPMCTFYVVMEGVGTWNYKFHQLLDQPK